MTDKMTATEAVAIIEDMYSLELAEPEAMQAIKGCIQQRDKLLESLRDLECEASAEIDPSSSLNIAILNARAAIAEAEGLS